MKDTCGNCKFYQDDWENAPMKSGYGRCRANPSPVGTNDGKWCGQHLPKDASRKVSGCHGLILSMMAAPNLLRNDGDLGVHSFAGRPHREEMPLEKPRDKPVAAQLSHPDLCAHDAQVGTPV